MEFFVKELGFPIAMGTALVGTFIWLARTLINHFLKQMSESTEERKVMTSRFATVVENHINHNSEMLNKLSGDISESRIEHTEMLRDLEFLKNK